MASLFSYLEFFRNPQFLELFLKFFEVDDFEKFDAFLGDMQPATFSMNNHLEGEEEGVYDEVRAETVGATLRQLVKVVRNKN